MEPQNTLRHIKETPLPHLPQEIIEEILVRLPVKSLLRLKRVSKTWRALISSNGFIKAHLEKSSNNKSFERHRIILGNSIVQANQCFLPSFLHEPLAAAVDFDYPACESTHGPLCIIGSCNGLVCIRKTLENFILWNPSTRKFKKLPPIIDDNERGVYCVLWTSGFGFDESNDDYKVFGILISSKRYGVERPRLVKVYSLKTDSWRKVGLSTFDSRFEGLGLGIYASGKLHWNGYGVVRGIVSFDLENEVFGTIMEWPNGVERCFLGQATIGGCLCCISPSGNKPDDHADYWLLQENGSWHKFATVERPLVVTGDGEYYKYLVPCFVGAGGDILFWDREDNIYTVLFKKEDGFVDSNVHDLYTHLPPVMYVESLVGL